MYCTCESTVYVFISVHRVASSENGYKSKESAVLLPLMESFNILHMRLCIYECLYEVVGLILFMYMSCARLNA